MLEVYAASIEDDEEIWNHHKAGKPDFYQVLGVDRGASQQELQKAHRGLAQQYHSGQAQGDEAAQERMRVVNMAAGVLRDEKMRAEYDQLLGMLEDARSQKGKPAGGPAAERDWYPFPGDDPYAQLINEAMRRAKGRKVRMKFDPKEAALLGDRGFKELERFSNFNRMFAKSARQRDGSVVVDFAPI